MRLRQLWICAALWGAAGTWSGGARAGSTAQAPTLPTRWERETITLHVDASLLLIDLDAYETVIAAVSAWQTSIPGLPTVVVEKAMNTTVGYERRWENQNTISFEPDGYPRAKGALAITIVSSDGDTGDIFDADIVLNGEHAFANLDTSSGSDDSYDLQNVLTHELGHLLGLDEAYDHPRRTMYPSSERGEIEKRSVTDGDRATLEELYSAPRFGSDSGCGGASVASAAHGRERTPGAGSWSFGAVAGLLGWLRTRRRH